MNKKKLIVGIFLVLVIAFAGRQSGMAAEKSGEAGYTAAELKLLTCLIYAEAGNQPYEGKLAVANVVLNRVKDTESAGFGHALTISEVIYDTKWCPQFSVAYVKKTDGTWKKKADGSYVKKGSALSKALTMYKTKEYEDSWQEETMKECKKAAKAALNGKNNIGDRLFFCRYTKAKATQNPNYVRIKDHIFY